MLEIKRSVIAAKLGIYGLLISFAGAIAYNIYWRNQPGVTKDNGQKIANVKNPHTLKDLLPGKAYFLVVTAVSKNGESRVSEEISYTAK